MILTIVIFYQLINPALIKIFPIIKYNFIKFLNVKLLIN